MGMPDLKQNLFMGLIRSKICGLDNPGFVTFPIKFYPLVSFLLFFMLTWNNVSAQLVLIAGTSFDPLPGNEGRTYIGVNDIIQYGLQPGNITITPPIAPNVNPNTFNGTYYYAITDNPYKLDNVRYNNIATPDYQLVVSSAPSTPSNIFEYKVTGLAPGTNVEVRITYCNVISPSYATCSPGEIVSVRGVINPDANNIMNGQEGPQLQKGNCTASNFVITQTSSNSNAIGPNGELTFRLNNMQTGPCKAVGITRIEIWGTPKPKIYAAQGSEVCAGEQISLQSFVDYSDNATFRWQVNTSGTWTNLNTTEAQWYETTTTPRTYQFRFQVTTPAPGSTAFTSDPISVTSISCCQVGNPAVAASRQTVYYDNFGRLDLNDKTGSTYYVWDYSNVLNPVEVQRTTATPFRWTLTPAPLLATFSGGPGPLQDGQYAVAAYLTGYNYPLNGYNGARLEWANRVTGPTAIPNPDLFYDHSGQPDGAALFLNCPQNTGGQVLYTRTINNLCPKQLFFECWIAVFTNSANGAYNPVNIRVRLTDGGNAANFVEATATATRQADGGGVWVRVATQINLTGNSVRMDIINNQNVSVDGNDLVLDDIKLMACAPPDIDLYFNLSTLSQAETVCPSNPLDLFTRSTALLRAYYGNSPLFLLQWTRTPTVLSSWQNIGSPQSGESFSIANPATHPSFSGLAAGGKVYFRVIAATSSIYTSRNNFQGVGNYANASDPCKNYSVSDPIEATVLCPLPVELISFKGQVINKINRLTWTTASEMNNHYFLIEGSADGKNFEVIGRVEGAGNTNLLSVYQFDDKSFSGNLNYYRLKQVDFDGLFAYSNIISINGNRSEVVVYPNPNDGSFTVYISDISEGSKIEVTDTNGRLVYSAATSENIQLSELPSGFYILTLYSSNEVQTRKIIVY
jgi:hypothetical protein